VASSEENRTGVPYHPGELEVQGRLGVAERAGRAQRGIHDSVPPLAARFVELQPFTILGGEVDGDVWASLLTAHPGFAVSPDPRIVEVRAMLPDDDPLFERLAGGGDLGMLWIDFLHRQRMRVNGQVRPRVDGFDVEVGQAYANCPQHITRRALAETPREEAAAQKRSVHESTALDRRQNDWIRATDTFFIASQHPEAGADVSHRGGPPGFVHVGEDGSLEWPDYQGNTMFNTLGNLVVDPRAGLLFVDFETGGTLQLTGRAEIRWGAAGNQERRVWFRPRRVLEARRGTSLRWFAPTESENEPIPD
jgi:uncharacterized protein